MTTDHNSGVDLREHSFNQRWLDCTRDQDNFSVFVLNDALIPDDHDNTPLINATRFWQSLPHMDIGDGHQILGFSDLTPSALAPFKSHALLLMQSASGWVIRFIGDQAAPLLGRGFDPAVHLSSLENESITPHLMKALSVVNGAPDLYGVVLPSIEDDFELHGAMIPLVKDGHGVDFALIILDAHALANEGDTPSISDDILNRLAECRATSSKIIKQSASNHIGLYDALATTLSLYEQGLDKPDDIKALLASENLKIQKRAPFTPLLKLVFGVDYDKTRLTEYAAALSYAWRQGVNGTNLTEFLKNQPGGIKGCVKEERLLRRAKNGPFGASSLMKAEEKLRTMPAIALSDMNLSEEFSLALVRKNTDGTTDLLAPYAASKSALETAIRQTGKNIDTPDLNARSQPLTE